MYVRNSCTCMYSMHVFSSLLHPSMSVLALDRLETTAPSLTWSQAQHSPSFSQCWSTTSVSMMCFQNSVTFSTLYSRAQKDFLWHSGLPVSGLSAAPCLPPLYQRSAICSGAHFFLSLFFCRCLTSQVVFLASVLPLSLVGFKFIQISSGPARHSSEGQKVSQIIKKYAQIVSAVVRVFVIW